jgi:hypothetical protein
LAHRRDCAFCGPTDEPLHREDVVPKWLAGELPEGDEARITVNAGRRDAPPTRTHEAVGHFGLIHRRACRGCNNGWMSGLESAAKPIIGPMLRGEETRLSLIDQMALARWLVKTAMNYELAQQRQERFFRAEDRLAMAGHLALPEYSRVFMARYVGRHIGTNADTPLTFYDIETPRNADPQQAPQRNATHSHQGYTYTFAFGQLCLQLLTVRRQVGIGQNLNVRVRGDWSDIELQIWPGQLLEVTWPPQFALDDDGRTAFEERWRATAPPQQNPAPPSRWDI